MRGSVDAILLYECHDGVDFFLEHMQQDCLPSAMQALLETIIDNRLWLDIAEGGEVKLVGRFYPYPLISAFGCFSLESRDLLYDLSALMCRNIGSCRFVDYFSAEAAAGRLARILLNRFGEEEISKCKFVAIPRGGGIVLGMLSYHLNLRPDQLVTFCSPDSWKNERVVVVDDCAFSGVRFQEFLDSNLKGSSVIFCPLYAPAGLCRAIEEAEPNVAACFSQEDLCDFAPSYFGQGYSQWFSVQRERMGRFGYWAGIVEHVAFSWGEPDTHYWDKRRNAFKDSWSLLPPNLCLKRRITNEKLKSTRRNIITQEAVLLETDGLQPLRAADRVLWAEMDSAIAVARMPENPAQTAPCYRLEGVAADMWRCVLTHSTLEGAERTLLKSYDVDPATLRADLATFVSELESNGLLIYR